MVEHPVFRELCKTASKRGLVVELHGPRGPVPPEGRPDKYLSTVRAGGTREQRESAFDRWLTADQDLSRYDRVAGTVAETQEAA